ncbi:hypothetical protein Tco_1174239 [Tanacetum coccineum]
MGVTLSGSQGLSSPQANGYVVKDAQSFMAVMTCQKSYSSSTSYDSCSESGKWFQSSMDLTLSGPSFDADFLVADSTYLKVAFGVIFKMLLFNPLVFSTKDLSRNLKLTASNSSLGEDFPTGKDSSIVSTGSTKVIPAGRTILFLHGVESYQKKLNITKPQNTFPGIKVKELYTPSFDPPGAVYEDLNKQKRVMRADELYKFSDGTLKLVRDELHHRALNFRLGYNKEMSRRKWSAVDRRRSELIVELIDKQMRERQIIRNLELLFGAWELEMDYRRMKHTK